MGVILGRQSYDIGRICLLVYGSLVQKLLNDKNNLNMIIIETEMNLFITDCNMPDVKHSMYY